MISSVLTSFALLATTATPPALDRHLELSAFVATPLVLSAGQTFGVDAAGLLGEAWRLGARLRFGAAEEDDRTWNLTHTELHALALAGWAHAIGPGERGRGEVGVTFGAGPIVLREVRDRHQAERLVSAGLVPSESAWSWGAMASLDVHLALTIVEGFGVGIRVGPRLAWVAHAPEGLGPVGLAASLGLTYSFGGER